MKRILLWLILKLWHVPINYQPPHGIGETEPFLLIGASDPLAPSITEQLADLKLKVRGDYQDYERLMTTAKAMREWAINEVKKQ